MTINRLATNDSGFIFDPATGASFTANKTAVFIIRRMQQGEVAKEIARGLIDTFEDAHGDISRDIEDFMQHLKILGISQEVAC